MPTTYAHDMFGKMVYHKLEEDIQELISRNKMQYIIGLHGPDILFYTRPFHKNRVNGLGYRLHQEDAAGFFERGRKLYCQTRNEGILAYLLGFICHFMLDSTCHPYIGTYMEKTGTSHDEIETEFDRELMVNSGKNPFHYHPSSVIHISKECVRDISEVLEGMSEKDICHTLKAMKFYTNFTVCPTEFKRKILLSLARTGGFYSMVQGRIIRKKPRASCEESTRELKRLFRLAIPETVTVIEDFYRNIESSGELGYRFWRNYN
ncbi:MAG: zinc dependent phospholipase C family protein [Eubacteriales bacterium]|nr:zinc dependent phospholipase C family protein [Eubacteriales bacterium]